MTENEILFAREMIKYIDKCLRINKPLADIEKHVLRRYKSLLTGSGRGKRARQKGAQGEREVAEIMKRFGIEARRGCQFSGGKDSPDVVTDLEDWHFEVKRVEALKLWDAMAQATKDAQGRKPVVVHRRNSTRWVAILDFETFLSLVTPKDEPLPDFMS